MLTRKQSQQLITEWINDTFSGYTVAVHDIKEFANDVLNSAFGNHSFVFRSTLESVYVQKLNEHFAIS